jgi:putative transcriptional regulator
VNLKELRQRTGLRAEDVAAEIGVAYSTIRNWEQGRTVPTLGVFQMQKLTQLYECNLDELAQAVREAQDREIASSP